MSIQLDKREDVDGSTILFVRDGNGVAIDSFTDKQEKEAWDFYRKCVEREKAGYPKFTVLANSSIDGGKI